MIGRYSKGGGVYHSASVCEIKKIYLKIKTSKQCAYCNVTKKKSMEHKKKMTKKHKKFKS